jgi:hypothetical protein
MPEEFISWSNHLLLKSRQVYWIWDAGTIVLQSIRQIRPLDSNPDYCWTAGVKSATNELVFRLIMDHAMPSLRWHWRCNQHRTCRYQTSTEYALQDRDGF